MVGCELPVFTNIDSFRFIEYVISELFVDYIGLNDGVCLMKAFTRDNITDSIDLSAESNERKALYGFLMLFL